MPRFNHYGRVAKDIPQIMDSSRAAEKAAEANRNINELRSEILSLKIMLQAMTEIMIERGVEIDQINAKIIEIMDRPETLAPMGKLSKPCPKCGRVILDNGTTPLMGTCLYCGTVVTFPPVIETDEEVEAEETTEDEGQDFTT